MKQFTNLARATTAAIAMLAGNALLAEDAAVLNPKTCDEWLILEGEKGDDVLTLFESNSALACKGKTSLSTKNAIKIDPEKDYKLSGAFKLAPNSKPSKFYFGIMPLDNKGEQIRAQNVNMVANTDTELSVDCNPEDTVIKIKNGEKWEAGSILMIAFNTDNSGKYADLPNKELSGIGIVKVEKNGNVYDVMLVNKCGKKYVAGTKIREHRIGGSYIYAFGGKDAQADWTEYCFTFKKHNLWPGTHGAKIIILANFGGDTYQTILLKDIKLEEVK